MEIMQALKQTPRNVKPCSVEKIQKIIQNEEEIFQKQEKLTKNNFPKKNMVLKHLKKLPH